MNYLLVSIIGEDCTNGGATSGRHLAFIAHPEGPTLRAHAEKSGHPILEIDEFPAETCGKRAGKANLRRGDLSPLVLVCRPEGRPAGMFGGNYVVTCDSRFPYAAPVAVFDRYED